MARLLRRPRRALLVSERRRPFRQRRPVRTRCAEAAVHHRRRWRDDDRYEFEDLAIITRQVRLDFRAEIAWIDPTAARSSGRSGWPALDPQNQVPDLIRQHFNPDRICALSALKRDSSSSAALARVSYANDAGGGLGAGDKTGSTG